MRADMADDRRVPDIRYCLGQVEFERPAIERGARGVGDGDRADEAAAPVIRIGNRIDAVRPVTVLDLPGPLIAFLTAL